MPAARAERFADGRMHMSDAHGDGPDAVVRDLRAARLSGTHERARPVHRRRTASPTSGSCVPTSATRSTARMFQAIIEAGEQVARRPLGARRSCSRVTARRSAPGSTRRCSRRWPSATRPPATDSARGHGLRLRVDAVQAVRVWVDLARAGDRRGARCRRRRWVPARARCRPPHRRARRAARRVRDQVGDRARHVRHAAAAAPRRSRRGQGPHVHRRVSSPVPRRRRSGLATRLSDDPRADALELAARDRGSQPRRDQGDEAARRPVVGDARSTTACAPSSDSDRGHDR